MDLVRTPFIELTLNFQQTSDLWNTKPTIHLEVNEVTHGCLSHYLKKKKVAYLKNVEAATFSQLLYEERK